MNKIAVLADIHGNIDALKAVLHHAGQKQVDAFFNLGDVLYGPLAPRDTWALVQNLNMITVRGNEDRLIYDADETSLSANPTLQFVSRELDALAINWLQNLPFDRIINKEFYLCHGTPQSDSQYLLEDVITGYPRLRTDAELLKQLEGINTPVILCGHSHLQQVVQLSTGQLVVNPGSVGLPAYRDDNPVHAMQNYAPHAGYAILERAGASWNVELYRVPYNYEAAAALAFKHNRADWAKYLGAGRV